MYRRDGHAFWESFVAALLECFEAAELMEQAWLPIGEADLAAPPSKRVFLPESAEGDEEEDEVTNVPARVAATMRLLDSRAVRVREDGKSTLTKLARRLDAASISAKAPKYRDSRGSAFPSSGERWRCGWGAGTGALRAGDRLDHVDEGRVTSETRLQRRVRADRVGGRRRVEMGARVDNLSWGRMGSTGRAPATPRRSYPERRVTRSLLCERALVLPTPRCQPGVRHWS